MGAPGRKWYIARVPRSGGLGRNVIALAAVSFFTDVSSEMIYPLLPFFLTSVLGAGPAFLGIVEGITEATASLLKLVSGAVSDRLARRRILVGAGYGTSVAAKALYLVAAAWPHP